MELSAYYKNVPYFSWIENVAILIESGFERGTSKHLDYKDRSCDSLLLYIVERQQWFYYQNNDRLRWRFVYC